MFTKTAKQAAEKLAAKQAAAHRLGALRLADAQGYDAGWHGRDCRPSYAEGTPEWHAYEKAYEEVRMLSAIPKK